MLRTGGRLGLLVFVQVADELLALAPLGLLPADTELDALLDAVGFGVLDRTIADLDDSPPRWDDAAAAAQA